MSLRTLAALSLALCGALGCDSGSPGNTGNARVATVATDSAPVEVPVSVPAEAKAPPAPAEPWLETAERHRIESLEGGYAANRARVREALGALFMADRAAEAERYAAAALERWPAAHEVLLALADLQRVTMRLEDAQRNVRAYLEREPGSAHGTLVLALTQVGLGELEPGLAGLERYLALPGADAAQRAEAELLRVRTLRRLGHPGRAVDSMLALLERRPLDPVALAEAVGTFARSHPTLASAAKTQHRWLLARGHRLNIEDPLTLERAEPGRDAKLGSALRAQDRRELLAATEQLTALHASEPGDLRCAYLLARLWLRLSRSRECHAVLDATEKLSARVVPSLAHLRARALAAEGERARASAAWRRAADALSDAHSDDAAPDELESPSAIMLAFAKHELESGARRDLIAELFARAAKLDPTNVRAVAGEAWGAIIAAQKARAKSLVDRLAEIAGAGADDTLRLRATIRGLEGDLRGAARELTALVVKSPFDDRNFAAFLLVFGSQKGVLEVEKIRVLRAEWRARRRRLDEQARRVAATPLEGPDASRAYHELGMLAIEMRERSLALDALSFAAELDSSEVASLEALVPVLARPRDVFSRWHALRRILDRQTEHVKATRLLATSYVDLGVRLDEARRLAGLLPERERTALLEKIDSGR